MPGTISDPGSMRAPGSDGRRTPTALPDADVRLDDRRASRRHASIFYSGSEFRVRDEGSANGTLLNGSKVVEYALRDGDELLVGDTLIRIRFRRR
jgi:pSer/pThr/pTyr-binding forkhead associated (FHA) protein